MDDTLKELLLPFFENDKYPGWKDIASSLLENKECIVAGTTCIWIGGIGNFIKLENADNFVGCNKYILDYESFISSDLVKSYLHEQLNLLEIEIKKHTKEIEIISNKYQYCHNLLRH